jgi:hypothetical protein
MTLPTGTIQVTAAVFLTIFTRSIEYLPRLYVNIFLLIDKVQSTIIFISRVAKRQTNAQVIFYFEIIFQVVYPSQCSGIYACQELFRQKVLTKFLTNRVFFLTVPFIDGRSISFETQLNSIVEHYGKYEYPSGDNITERKIMKVEISFFEMLAKSLKFYHLSRSLVTIIIFIRLLTCISHTFRYCRIFV